MISFFSEFLDFYKYFLPIFLWNRLKPKQTCCIPKHLLKDDWMFLQHWATCWCRRPSVGQTISVAVYPPMSGGGPRVVVSTAAFHARVRGSVPGLGGLKETKMFLPHPRVKVSIVGSLRDREVACSASDRQGSNFESCVWRTVSSQSSHHPQEVLLAQFSLYVHKGGLKPD